jgi:hypothetical protein
MLVPLPLPNEQEYQELCQRSDEGTITEAERKRLLALIEERDLRNAKRLEILGELARLRGVTLREIMVEFDIRPR